jgi:hypothetical protein
MRNIRNFNSYLKESKNIEDMPLLVRTYIKKLVSASVNGHIDLDDIFSVIKKEFDSIKSNKNNKLEFSVLSDEEKDKMMSDAIRMSETEWMKKYKIGDHGDYLNRAKSKWNLD